MPRISTKFSTQGELPSWLVWETGSVLAGTPPTSPEGSILVSLSANYSVGGASFVIESRLELRVLSLESVFTNSIIVDYASVDNAEGNAALQ